MSRCLQFQIFIAFANVREQFALQQTLIMWLSFRIPLLSKPRWKLIRMKIIFFFYFDIRGQHSKKLFGGVSDVGVRDSHTHAAQYSNLSREEFEPLHFVWHTNPEMWKRKVIDGVGRPWKGNWRPILVHGERWCVEGIKVDKISKVCSKMKPYEGREAPRYPTHQHIITITQSVCIRDAIFTQNWILRNSYEAQMVKG